MGVCETLGAGFEPRSTPQIGGHMSNLLTMEARNKVVLEYLEGKLSFSEAWVRLTGLGVEKEEAETVLAAATSGRYIKF